MDIGELAVIEGQPGSEHQGWKRDGARLVPNVYYRQISRIKKRISFSEVTT